MLLTLSLVLLLSSVSIGSTMLPMVVRPPKLPTPANARFYGIEIAATGVDHPGVLLGSAFAAAIGVVGTVLLRNFFRKSISPSLFFLAGALAMHGFTVVRVLQVPVAGLGIGQVYSLLLTRMVLFFHFAGVLSLFAASCYAVGASSPRLWSVSGVIVVTALALAYAAPLDATTMTGALIHRFQDAVNLQYLGGFLGLLSIANYVRSARSGEESNGSKLPIAIVALVLGRELSLYVSTVPIQLAAAALLTFGLIAVIRGSYSVYLWS